MRSSAITPFIDDSSTYLSRFKIQITPWRLRITFERIKFLAAVSTAYRHGVCLHFLYLNALDKNSVVTLNRNLFVHIQSCTAFFIDSCTGFLFHTYYNLPRSVINNSSDKQRHA